MNRTSAGFVQGIVDLDFVGGGITSIDAPPRKGNEGLSSVAASPINPTASLVETIDVPFRIEAGPIEITAGLVEIEAGLMKIIAGPVRAPSKLGFISFDLGSLR